MSVVYGNRFLWLPRGRGPMVLPPRMQPFARYLFLPDAELLDTAVNPDGTATGGIGGYTLTQSTEGALASWGGDRRGKLTPTGRITYSANAVFRRTGAMTALAIIHYERNILTSDTNQQVILACGNTTTTGTTGLLYGLTVTYDGFLQYVHAGRTVAAGEESGMRVSPSLGLSLVGFIRDASNNVRLVLNSRVTDAVAGAAPAAAATASFCIGSMYPSRPTGFSAFGGGIDQVAIYDQAMSVNDIRFIARHAHNQVVNADSGSFPYGTVNW